MMVSAVTATESTASKPVAKSTIRKWLRRGSPKKQGRQACAVQGQKRKQIRFAVGIDNLAPSSTIHSYDAPSEDEIPLLYMTAEELDKIAEEVKTLIHENRCNMYYRYYLDTLRLNDNVPGTSVDEACPSLQSVESSLSSLEESLSTSSSHDPSTIIMPDADVLEQMRGLEIHVASLMSKLRTRHPTVQTVLEIQNQLSDMRDEDQKARILSSRSAMCSRRARSFARKIAEWDAIEASKEA